MNILHLADISVSPLIFFELLRIYSKVDPKFLSKFLEVFQKFSEHLNGVRGHEDTFGNRFVWKGLSFTQLTC